MVVRPGIRVTGFDEFSFFSFIFGFQPHWDYKHYNENLSQKMRNLSNTSNKQLKCDVFDGSVVNGIRESVLFSFVLNKPPRYKRICEPETIHFKENLF